MPFRCYKCGKCCTTFGHSITITQRTHTEILGKSALTGEGIRVPLSSELCSQLDDTSVFTEYPDACPFLRQTSPHIWSCLAYAAMPSHCKKFECYSMLILNADKEIIGKVREKRTLSTENSNLRNLFDTQLASLTATEDVVWRKEARKILISNGYTVKM